MNCIENKYQIISILKNMLTETRFYHCLRVADEAQHLASCWGEREDKLYLAGLLHDCARDLPPEELLPLLPSYLGKEVYSIPAIFHALAGPAVVEREFGIKDYQIWHAICWHATSCEVMSKFDKILFIADFCEAGREFPVANRIREIAKKDWEEAYRQVLKEKVFFLLSRRLPVYSATWRAWNKENEK
ncbi:MAG TPA: bis(5'-nucleosyl)-tetraphosphatase (symmetrical) YqeK [Candidatus Atribacteria bacterium]|nr:bis(5'-nucleosyl)-tetraphosphatase (symmetrical) YqeK [Candidatus Atribacteria bacterium]HQE24481.1 bis(5'-nucleosyl)-tetraphosphatase (symmetrical) YqeK [Candidatus Atribacteria bacterium]